jgi:uncharacterized protein YdeI (YjbR/CyaY-like superfamily)
MSVERIMKTGETLTVVTREEFRQWLADHHRSRKEIWLIFYYKRTGKPTIAYNDVVEEAICYGWIDSQQNRMDDERFVRRFSPRRRRSHPSRHNKERALRMLRAGKMTEAGMAALPAEVVEAWKAGD